jgi:hypothetical protein
MLGVSIADMAAVPRPRKPRYISLRNKISSKQRLQARNPRDLLPNQTWVMFQNCTNWPGYCLTLEDF